MKGKYNVETEEKQRACMLALVRDILSDKSVESVTIENVHGALSVSRSAGERNRDNVEAIGFTFGFSEDDGEECE